MSEKALFERYLSCYVCADIFKDPVSLRCSHNFCSDCLQQSWKEAGKNSCPICERKASNDHPPVNFTLKMLSESFTDIQQSGLSKTEAEQTIVGGVCEKHPREPRLFCVDEYKILCSVCEDSFHRSHKVINIKQGVNQLKDQLSCDFKFLQKKKDTYQRVQQTYNEMSRHSEKQLVSTERQIRAEFDRIHQFLREEEESRLAALREEGEQKRKAINREVKMVEDQISALSDSMCAIEAELQKDSMDFLSRYRESQRRAKDQRLQSDPQLVSGLLINVAKHLGNLSFSVWDKMKDKFHCTPIILDPNTANAFLDLSDDLTSVRVVAAHQQLPDNPERSTNYTNVFGSVGFSSGQHSWEVEVGDLSVWNLGVARESADRKNDCYASEEDGFWCLSHRSGEYFDTFGQEFQVKRSLHRIRIQLDYDRGEVSFYNSEDLTLICTHRDSFSEKLFPYFHVNRSDDAETTNVKVCPSEISF